MTILQAMQDPALFGPWFKGDSWTAWRGFLAALFGLPLPTTADVDAYFKHTGRTAYAPGTPAREGWVVAGVRAGKSRVAALVAVYLACFRNYTAMLAPGERAVVMVLAGDRKQARVILGYVRAFLELPLLRQLVTNETRESIELSNHVVIEIHTSSFRSVRGFTCAAVLCDEVAYWPTDEAGANPDMEILKALRPRMATIPGALLLCISSPYARRGALWEAYRKHYGHDDDPVLVWQAPTVAMNPNVDPQVIADAYEEDEASAAAEYGAEFRHDIESYVSRETIEASIIPGRHELPPAAGIRYRAFTDPSGGSADSFTLAIAHEAGERTIIDAVRETKPPFSPADVVKTYAELLKTYRITTVTGDRYAGDWAREPWRLQGVTYTVSEKVKSDIYRDLLPLLTSTSVELPDNPTLRRQLQGLERRTARGGKDSIDHAPRAHDDLANAVAGVCVVGRSSGSDGSGANFYAIDRYGNWR